MIEQDGAISPKNTLFVLLSFEGPDVYSTAGGLGTRVTELSEALAAQGYTTHLIFIGDPTKPSVESRVDGHLVLERWSQWVSKYYLNGVYDGEEEKLYDFSESVPYHIYDTIVRPAAAEGKMVVVMGEDWHTADAICRTSDLLHWFGVRHKVILLWNLNSLMSLHRINWGRLNFVATLCTVSRYMKHKMWNYGVNPLVIPNGIPTRHLNPVDEAAVKRLREIARQGDPRRMFLFKIGRLDPDKRWRMAIEAVARLKHSGHEPFGLVALEAMAAQSNAVTGSTGEDYAISFENAIVTETDDPDEIVGYLLHLRRHPEEQERIRSEGCRTAEQFLWDQVIENLVGKLEFLARKQNIVLA